MKARIIGLLATLVCATSHALAQTPDAEREKLIAAARQEGVVRLYTGLVGNPTSAKIAQAFQAKYGVRMETLDVRATELRERLRTEKVAGRVLADVMNTSGLQTRQIAAEDGTIDRWGPLAEANGLAPGVVAGWQDRDVHAPIFMLRYALLINTRLVPDPPKTYADLLDPKWKGRILADDFRAAGGGNTFFSVTFEKFGRGWHEKLAAQDVVFTRDQRAAEGRVARGEYAIYLPFLLNNTPATQGLPVKPHVLAEGVTYTPYSASLVRNAPHPNAGRLLIAFMMSREGQAIYAAHGLGPVVDGLADLMPATMKDVADPKMLGERDGAREVEMLREAKALYK